MKVIIEQHLIITQDEQDKLIAFKEEIATLYFECDACSDLEKKIHEFQFAIEDFIALTEVRG